MDLTTPGRIIFDPVALGLNPAISNVFNFTTINIGPGVTVVLTAKIFPAPVYWLAQGAVTISGVIDLSGENGHDETDLVTERVPAAGGAGGYFGGVGGSASIPATAGSGPGGSPAATNGQQMPGVPYDGLFTGSQYLVPLTGGSGGGGNNRPCGRTFGPGGGAGGGAILIASTTSITLPTGGGVGANGGRGGVGCNGAPTGSGGAIRLVAPIIDVASATLIAVGGLGSSQNPGRIRLEGNSINMSGNIHISAPYSTSALFKLAVPQTPPSSLRVTSINGNPITANPFSFFDTSINTAGAVPVVVQAQYVPPGTIPKIFVFSESGSDQTISCSSPLQGTLQQSTCTASIGFPTGGSRGFVKATW